MDLLFPRTFLLVFCQLAVGGLFCLSIPPFHEMDRGYYKSSAFVYWAIGVLATIGHIALWLRPRAPSLGAIATPELVLWLVFCAASGFYLYSLWGDEVRWRARSFSTAWIAGTAALIAAAGSFSGPAGPIGVLIHAFCFVVGALALGSAASGMLLGHWYLIDRDLSLDPLWRVLRLYLAILGVQTVLLLLAAAALFAFGPLTEGIAPSPWTIAARLAISPIGGLILAAMIWRTLLIPQTMAATGLFYIAILAVTVGELIGRYLLFRTGMPL